LNHNATHRPLTVTAISTGNGSGIGGSFNNDTTTSGIEQLIISGGHITAQGSDFGIGGIGVQSLNLYGPAVLICNSSHFPVTATWIVLGNDFLLFVTEGSDLFSVSPSLSNDVSLAILFGKETEQNVENLSQIFLQIGSLDLPVETFWSFCVSGVVFKRCFGNESTKVKSLIVSLPSHGAYSIGAFGPGLAGFLEDSNGLSTFEVRSTNAFIAKARFVPFGSTVPTPSFSSTPTESDSNFFVILCILLGSFGFVVILHRVIIAIICRRWKRQRESTDPSSALALSLVDLRLLTVGKIV
jgi:hypothetical protein